MPIKSNDAQIRELQEEQLRSLKRQKRFYLLFFAVLAALYLIATVRTSYNPLTLLIKSRNFIDFAVNDLFPPKIDSVIGLWEIMLQTIGLAFISTFVSGVIAFLLCFAASSQIAPGALVKTVRAIASLQRNIPDVIWVFILVMVFGIGTTVGIIALVLHTTGFLMRAFADVVDEVGRESMEALDSVGANLPAKLAQCVIPASVPGFVSWLLYAVELNVRAAAVVGALGGGGIGLVMMGYLKSFRYHTGFGIILVIAVTVIIVDIITSFLRKRVLL
ncbi:MAG: ABC transporter permease subunit [Oscillospiraceae bacterium]|jgi:phosphonate transport system permease protein|nr:ABC transporter permease subunit [Oscillospiraceae bacterium]